MSNLDLRYERYVQSAADRETLSDACETVRQFTEAIENLEAEKKSIITGTIAPLAERLQLPKRVIGDGWDLRRNEGRKTTRIVPEKLLERGVDMDTIVAATEEKIGEPFYSVVKIKAKGDS